MAEALNAVQAARVAGPDRGKVGGDDQARQDEPRRRGSREDPSDGEDAELGEARETREGHAAEPKRRRRDRQRESAADPRPGARWSLAAFAMANEEHGVVDRDPQHRHAEAERDAVQEAKHELHGERRDGGAQDQGHGDGSDHERIAKAPDEQSGDQQRGHNGQPYDIGPDGMGGISGEDGGSRDEKAQSGRSLACRVESLVDGVERRVLHGERGAVATQAGDEQRAVLVGREPDAIPDRRVLAASGEAQQRGEGAGRVGQAELLDQRRGGGLQFVQKVLEILTQGWNLESGCGGGG